MSRTNDENVAAGSGARADALPACGACGAAARRAPARFCATCGRSLREREYRPADGLRASYRWQTSAELSRRSRESVPPRGGARRAERLSAPSRPRPRADVNSRARFDELAPAWPDEASRRARPTSANRRARTSRRNEPTAHAYVLMAYALMPYVGIFFCPAAVVCGAVGLRRAGRERHPAAEREAERSIVYAILLFGAHSLLWLVSYGLTEWLSA